MNLFYSSDINGDIIVLSEEESKHCTKVLRKTVGEQVNVIDGLGNMYLARIDSIGKHDCCCSILEKTENFGNHNYNLRMCVAPTKNIDRFEFFVEKAVEIGVDEIIPVCCSNSERRNLKLDRIERIVLSAMKQSYKATKPRISELVDIQTILNQNFEGGKYIAHCENQDKVLLRDIVKKGSTATIMIGPEGDFSLSEIEQAKQNGWTPISLGDSRLRTETAAIAAVHTVNLVNQ